VSTANLRWNADTAGAEAQILALKKVIGSIKGESSLSLGSASKDFKRVGSDASSAARDTKRAWRDAETGLLDLDRAAKKVNKTMSGGPFGLFDALGNVGYATLKMGSAVQKATSDLGQMVSAGGSAGGVMGTLGSALGGLAPILGAVTVGLAALAAALVVLPAIVAAVTFVLVALLDAATTLAAVVGGLAAPLVLVTGLLGGLGAAFAYVATQSFKNKATMQDQKDALLAVHVAQQTYNEDLAKYGAGATQTEKALLALHKAQDTYEKAQQGVALGTLDLEDKFHSLVDTLSKDFAPEILRLGQAAATALKYLGNIAKLPLEQAFRNLATRGVKLFSAFIYGVANVLKKPFRLAIEIAFGKSGTTVQKAATDWWDSFTGYLFGYQKTHPVFAPDGKFLGITTSTVNGALQPLLDWFGRQHFTKTGLRWSDEIIGGFVRSGGARKLQAWASSVAGHAGHVAGIAFKRTLTAELSSLAGWFSRKWISWSVNPLSHIAPRLGPILIHAISGAFDVIKAKASSTWNAIVAKVRSLWRTIVSFIEHPLSIHIDWPSPPGWFDKLSGGAGSLARAAGAILPAATGGLKGSRPRALHRKGSRLPPSCSLPVGLGDAIPEMQVPRVFRPELPCRRWYVSSTGLRKRSAYRRVYRSQQGLGAR
jgi:hypothetical protein